MSKIVMWQMKPTWGLPNASPFCMKLETWLRMAELPFETRSLNGPPRSPSGKVPYIERADGSLLADSSTIIATLTKEHGVTLDSHLGGAGEAIGTLLQRTFEEDLYFHLLFDRWAVDKNWKIVKQAYFGQMPWPLRVLIVPWIRRGVVASARAQGVARLPAEERTRRVRAGIKAVAFVLGDKPYFFEQPSRFDATAYAFLANALETPEEVETACREAIRQHRNLVDFCGRMKVRYFA